VRAVRAEVAGASSGSVARTLALCAALVAGAVLAVATVPAETHWLHLPSRHDHADR
jgi:hypothetical protein